MKNKIQIEIASRETPQKKAYRIKNNVSIKKQQRYVFTYIEKTQFNYTFLKNK